mmetsp:Transcript_18169/g.39267  ORF Transcript_18169/g.39267 Transcript_18169/m.39267 type:complete len:201 (+) Transcript_18169:7179-7781(+)
MMLPAMAIPLSLNRSKRLPWQPLCPRTGRLSLRPRRRFRPPLPMEGIFWLRISHRLNRSHQPILVISVKLSRKEPAMPNRQSLTERRRIPLLAKPRMSKLGRSSTNKKLTLVGRHRTLSKQMLRAKSLILKANRNSATKQRLQRTSVQIGRKPRRISRSKRNQVLCWVNRLPARRPILRSPRLQMHLQDRAQRVNNTRKS